MKNKLVRRDFLKQVGCGIGLTILPGCVSSSKNPEIAEDSMPKGKFVIAHRGASGYAPEHTIDSYQLALKQGAEYVEQDLQITRDGVLVCSHDLTLNRTTNVEEIFPNRFREEMVKGKKEKRWYIHDFTLKDLKQLDAGAWFDPKFKGAKIPTWVEAIDLIKGQAGLCPETKGPEYYGKLGFDMEKLVVATLTKCGLNTRRARTSTPLLIQSFSKAGVQKLKTYDSQWPLLLLTFTDTKWTPQLLDEAKQTVAAIGPFKRDVTQELVEQAHARGLKVVPFTFRVGDEKGFPNVKEEMRHYLYTLGVDAMFTDNPDQFPRT